MSIKFRGDEGRTKNGLQSIFEKQKQPLFPKQKQNGKQKRGSEDWILERNQ